MTIRIGELFAGYGGLGMGVQSVIGGEVVWFSEFDAAPSKILAHHWPDVPNHGDITLIDWSKVEPVDVLTGGFPCQDVSLAGARAGLMDGTRSGLWSEFAKAIDVLRPGLVVIENVRGLLSAKTMEEIDEGASDLEPGPSGLGELGRGNRPVLNAFGRVLGDLAELGYDAEWVGIRAADAGAPHGRYRVFIIAHPAVPHARCAPRTPKLTHPAQGRAAGVQQSGAIPAPDPEHIVGYGTGRAWDGWTEPADGRFAAADTNVAAGDGKRARPQPEDGVASVAADTGSERLREYAGESPAEEAGTGSGDLADGPGGLRLDTDWGPYLPAIERWESVTGRPAPSPTKPDGKSGNHRLSATFVEWMMGLPAGHVTNPAIGLTRNEQLKALGNGVVWQQAALAVRLLLGRT
jgi:DNA (cytosine-5)-methyltransferase 1